MEEILHHLGWLKAYKSWYFYNLSAGAGFLPSTAMLVYWRETNQTLHPSSEMEWGDVGSTMGICNNVLVIIYRNCGVVIVLSSGNLT